MVDYPDTPLPDVERAADSLAWNAIKELFLIGYFKLVDESQNEQLWNCGFGSRAQLEFCDFSLRKYRFSVRFLNDHESWGELSSALRERHPSAQLTQAFREYDAITSRLAAELKELAPAQHDDLVRYLHSSACADTEAWSLRNGVRLEPVTWHQLAAALNDASIELWPSGVSRTISARFGRMRTEIQKGWAIKTRQQERWNGNFPEAEQLLLEDGEVVTVGLTQDTIPEKPDLALIQRLARRH